TQCSACRLPATGGCFPRYLPYYNSSLSRTVRAVPCDDGALCGVAPEKARCARGSDDVCVVVATYGAGVELSVLGTDAFTFPSSGTTVTLAFGCVSQTRISRRERSTAPPASSSSTASSTPSSPTS
ncbi:Os03g0586099, partial [Oryza sativa Japonica Group]